MATRVQLIVEPDLFLPICACLDAKENLNLMLLSKRFHHLIRSSDQLWRFLCQSKWGRRREIKPVFDESMQVLVNPLNSKWLEAYKVFKNRRQAALHGRWFEFDGHFAQTGFCFDFSMHLHCVERMHSSIPVPPIPQRVVDQSSQLVQEQINNLQNKLQVPEDELIGSSLKLKASIMYLLSNFCRGAIPEYPESIQVINNAFLHQAQPIDVSQSKCYK